MRLLHQALGLGALLFGSGALAAAGSTAANPRSAPSPVDARVVDADHACCQTIVDQIGLKSNLPIVYINTNNQVIDPAEGAPKIDVAMCTCLPPPGANSTFIVSGSDPDIHPPFFDFQGMAALNVHGSTTRKQYVKKSYAIKLKARNGTELESVDFPFLGLPPASDWVLYGPEEDAEMGIRNWLSFDSWRAMDNGWGPRSRFIEVIVNEHGGPMQPLDYRGIYLLVERIERQKHRLDITKLNPARDLSGGYIFDYENNNFLPGDVLFNSSVTNLTFTLREPKNLSDPNILTWINNYVERADRATFGPSFADPLKGYRAYFNLSHLVDYFLITEYSKNPDGYRGSVYLFKDAGKTIGFAPWDYNEAYGMCCGYPIEGYENNGQSNGTSGGSAISPEGWRFNICAQPSRCLVDPVDGLSKHFRRFWEDPAYRRAVAVRYRSLRAGAWSDATIQGKVNTLVTQIRPAVLRNYDRYRTLLVNPLYFTSGEQRWNYEVNTMMTWLHQHLAWMSKALDAQLVVSK